MLQSVIYAGDLENSALIGRNASAKITISAAGTITDAHYIPDITPPKDKNITIHLDLVKVFEMS